MDNFKEKYAVLHGAVLSTREEHHKAQRALDEAMDKANEAEGKMLDACGEFKTFMAAQAKALREKLLDSEIFNAKLQVTTQSGDTVTTDFSQIWIGDSDGVFRISVDMFNAAYHQTNRYVTLGIYETPDEVEDAIESLREAIRHGDKAFTFELPLTASDLLAEQIRIKKWLDGNELDDAQRKELEVQFFKNEKALAKKVVKMTKKMVKIFGGVSND